MTNISRDSEVVEINEPPAYSYGERVRCRRTIRNDGTYPGKDIGEVLARKHEEGYVTSIGTFLQQFYVYGVEFIETGNRVGMKTKELESLDNPEEDPKEVKRKKRAAAAAAAAAAEAEGSK